MTEIDVPDWVVEQAAYAIHRVMKGSSFTDSDWTNGSILGRDNEWRKQVIDAATSALTAALGAWVETVGFAVPESLHQSKRRILWFDVWVTPHPPFTIPLYTLRQEKPE